ncbi:hypothetical protein HPB47_011306 [Ixodes persulcatus]|uniref:Uncharacterized protein n=1 Tax=Ixodes persulcatus TaxID=34615 RepID=A0AC60NWP3_IXOPE|nr:hypothetical protein HPB47_011306 [Ixodes persulcatus]
MVFKFVHLHKNTIKLLCSRNQLVLYAIFFVLGRGREVTKASVGDPNVRRRIVRSHAGGARVPPVADVSSLARGATRKLPEAGTGSTEPPTRNRSDPPHVPHCAAPGVASRNHLPSAPRLHSRSENRLCYTETPYASYTIQRRGPRSGQRADRAGARRPPREETAEAPRRSHPGASDSAGEESVLRAASGSASPYWVGTRAAPRDWHPWLTQAFLGRVEQVMRRGPSADAPATLVARLSPRQADETIPTGWPDAHK